MRAWFGWINWEPVVYFALLVGIIAVIIGLVEYDWFGWFGYGK